MTELVLLRHGETDWNRELRFQGQVDVPLNATGHAQAQRLAQRLMAEPIDHLVSSDLSRARQTADPFAQQVQAARGIGSTRAALREQAFGRIDGMRVEDIKRDHADVWAGWTQFQSDYVVPEGKAPGSSTPGSCPRCGNWWPAIPARPWPWSPTAVCWTW